MTSGRNRAARSTASTPSWAVAHLVAEQSQHHGQALGPVPVVVHHEDAPRGADRSARLADGSSATLSARPASDRQGDGERAALALAVARGRDRAAVHLDQPLDQRQPDAQARRCSARCCGPPGRTCRRSLGSDSAGMPMPVSRTDTATSPALRSADSQIVPPALGVLGAVGEQVANTWASRVRSASRWTGRGAGRRSARAPPRRSAGRAVSTALSTTSASVTRVRRSSILLRLIRDTSSRSSISRTMCGELPVHHRLGLARGRSRSPRPGGSPAGRCGSGPAGSAARGPAAR